MCQQSASKHLPRNQNHARVVNLWKFWHTGTLNIYLLLKRHWPDTLRVAFIFSKHLWVISKKHIFRTNCLIHHCLRQCRGICWGGIYEALFVFALQSLSHLAVQLHPPNFAKGPTSIDCRVCSSFRRREDVEQLYPLSFSSLSCCLPAALPLEQKYSLSQPPSQNCLGQHLFPHCFEAIVTWHQESIFAC